MRTTFSSFFFLQTLVVDIDSTKKKNPSVFFKGVWGPGGSALSSRSNDDGFFDTLRAPTRELGWKGKDDKGEKRTRMLLSNASFFSQPETKQKNLRPQTTLDKTSPDHHQALARRGRDLGPAGAAATLRKICFFFVLEGVKEGDRERKESIRKTSPSFFSPLVSSTFLLARKKTSVHRPSPGIPPLRRRPRSGRLQERAFAPGIA